jgi:hypothetical protein
MLYTVVRQGEKARASAVNGPRAPAMEGVGFAQMTNLFFEAWNI